MTIAMVFHRPTPARINRVANVCRENDQYQGELFHINRIVHWFKAEPMTVNQELTFGDVTNPYFKYLEEKHLKYPIRFQDGTVAHYSGLHFLRKVYEKEVNPDNLP